jgi:CheY-like chemotaxis protein
MDMARILVVDDDPLFAAMLAQDLLRSGHRPTAIDDAAAALKAIDTGTPFDAVITDIMMPGMDGIELIRALRARVPDLPIVALSSGGEHRYPNILSMARALGADRALYKPVSATVIVSTLRAVLGWGPATATIDGTAALDTPGEAARSCPTSQAQG